MLKVISGTILARIIITVMGLLVAVVGGHRLGAEGLGVIGLVVLGISLVRLGMDLVAGSALVYLAPRVALGRLLRPSYLWALFIGLAGYLVVSLFNLVPEGYALHVAVLAFLQGVNAVHLNILVGQQRIRANNVIAVVQAIMLVGVFTWLAFQPGASAMSYVTGAYASALSSLLLGTLSIRKRVEVQDDPSVNVMQLLFRQGSYIQMANGMQLINYRLAYWLIEKFKGTAQLGVYTVANQLAEGAWLVPKSLALVLYSKISNTDKAEEQRLITLTFLKTSMASASAIILVLLVLPSTLFQCLFGPEVVGITPLIALLAPGILSMSATQAWSHFFSGTARNVHNVGASGIGMVITIGAGLLLVPQYGLVGAALCASLAYGASALYQTVVFMRITNTRFTELWPNRADVQRLGRLLGRSH